MLHQPCLAVLTSDHEHVWALVHTETRTLAGGFSSPSESEDQILTVSRFATFARALDSAPGHSGANTIKSVVTALSRLHCIGALPGWAPSKDLGVWLGNPRFGPVSTHRLSTVR